jgi:hypothetical protein
MASTADRNAALRKEKLAAIREQVACGTLTIRKMTTSERKLNPPRPDKPARKRHA